MKADDWSAIDALSQRIKAAVEDGDWVIARRVLAERTEIMKRFFLDEVSETEAPRVADAIRKTLEHDRALQAMSDEGRNELQDKLKMLKLRRKARQTYSVP